MIPHPTALPKRSVSDIGRATQPTIRHTATAVMTRPTTPTVASTSSNSLCAAFWNSPGARLACWKWGKTAR